MNAPAKALPALERAEGELVIRAHNKGFGNALAHLLQDGCLKARFPKMHDDGPKRGVLINTSGGIADGDILSTKIVVAENTSLALTTQAAERFYRARDLSRPAIIRTELAVADAGTLCWMPQETIAFDGSAAHRRFELNVAKGGQFIGGEMLVLGRTAMEEEVRRCNLFDRWRISYADTLVYADGLRLSGTLDKKAQGKAQLDDAIAIATLFVVGEDLGALQSSIRSILEDQTDIIVGATVREPVLICRCASKDSKALIALISSIISCAEQALTGETRASRAILPRWIF